MDEDSRKDGILPMNRGFLQQHSVRNPPQHLRTKHRMNNIALQITQLHLKATRVIYEAVCDRKSATLTLASLPSILHTTLIGANSQVRTSHHNNSIRMSKEPNFVKVLQGILRSLVQKYTCLA